MINGKTVHSILTGTWDKIGTVSNSFLPRDAL